MTDLSGWCSGPAGCTSPSAHRVCQMRMDDGIPLGCHCTSHGGHTHKPKDGDN